MEKKDMKKTDVKRESIQSYFTKEFLEKINEMSSDEMFSLLRELESTRVWIAIIKYSHERLNNAQQALITLDPFKEPTVMARYQGTMSGLLDLQEAVISLKKKSEEAVDPQKKAEKEIEELGGSYSVS